MACSRALSCSLRRSWSLDRGGVPVKLGRDRLSARHRPLLSLLHNIEAIVVIAGTTKDECSTCRARRRISPQVLAQNHPDPASRLRLHQPALVATPGASEWVSCVSSPATNRPGRTLEKGAGNLANSPAGFQISLTRRKPTADAEV